MKKIVKLFGLVAMTATLATSCSKDDSPSTPASTFVPNPAQFQGDINDGDVFLDASLTYNLTGPIIINDGATLTIPAGTKIQGTGGTSAYIAVAQGGKIFIQGTATNPVVMTSANATKAPGDWGGLVICGKAPINSAASASAEVSGLIYGGTNPSDSSGSIEYLRLEYTGAIYNADKEFNGLSLFGVGSGTTIDYVQIYRSSDDGVEFFGGTVNTSHMVSTFNEDDQFDWTEGWSGTNNYWYGKLGNNIGNRGIEADNLEANYSATPIANPTITNISLIGISDTGYNGTEQDGMKLRRGTKGMFTNVYIENFTKGFNIENDETIANIPSALKATNVSFVNVTTKSSGKTNAATSVDVSAFFTESATTVTGAGNGASVPTWAQGWTTGL
jgi:hypothetical protein